MNIHRRSGWDFLVSYVPHGSRKANPGSQFKKSTGPYLRRTAFINQVIGYTKVL